MKTPPILDLRPTQFVLGMKEVQAKISKMKSLNAKEMDAFCDERKIPVVIGPKKQVFMIDHHHFARACWELDINKYELNVIKDLSDLGDKDFWNFMVKKDWVYLYDQFGLGPHSPWDLPADIRGLADDPFRSLAWALRDIGAVKKVDEPFFEFKWAAFFRLNLDLKLHSKSDFKDAIALAKKLAGTKTAAHLPGYIAAK